MRVDTTANSYFYAQQRIQPPVTNSGSVSTGTYGVDKVSISDAAKAMLAHSQSATGQDADVQKRLDEIKSRPALQRTPDDTEYLKSNDKRYADILEKIKANGMNGSDALSADELDYMQKASGMVNTMSQLTPKEKVLYDDLVAKGNHEAAHGLLLVGMSRMGMEGQQVTLPNGKSFSPVGTEITADNIRNLFKQMFVDSDGSSSKAFDALASYLDKKPADQGSAGA